MKKLIIISFMMILTCNIFAKNPIAVLLKVKGEIMVQTNEQEIEGKDGTFLYNDYLVSSAENSFSAIKFVDGGAIIRLFPNSEIAINASEKDGKLSKSNNLKKGSILSKIKEKYGDFEVKTPSAIASVKGTEFITKLQNNGSTILFTIDGKVQFENKLDDEKIIVQKNEKAVSIGKGSIELTSATIDDLGSDIADYYEESKETDKLKIEFENPKGETKEMDINLE